MIDISKLTEADKGRIVRYLRLDEQSELGHISSWNDRFIFVAYAVPSGFTWHVEATRPEDLEWA